MAKLQDELRKQKPFESLEQEAALNLFRTSDRLQHRLAQLFREHGLTPSQYNILRILRGEGKPLPCLEIAHRTITVVPGITGLIDRLEEAGMVKRQRSEEDRRVVNVSITAAGKEVLDKLDEPLRQLHRRLLAHFSQQELTLLVQLLEKARQKCEEPAD